MNQGEECVLYVEFTHTLTLWMECMECLFQELSYDS